MAHFAEIDENNIVIRVVAVDNTVILTSDNKESEVIGIDFCKNLLGGNWKQTSYNGNFRKRYAGIGYTYDAALDAFIAPQPYPSWTLDPVTTNWVAPIPMPTDGQHYTWNETTQAWDVINEN